MAVIPFYGDDDEVTHQRIMKDGVWNDHVAVQSALAAIHHLKTKAAALDAAAAVDGDHVDIRTVTAYESGFEAGKDEGAAERDRLQGRVATLQKALDDHWAADLKAAKAIFAETGRKWGFPDNTEVVAFYVAEVGRLESELKLAKSAAEDYDKDCIDMRYQR
ncbi:MAG: hypothetical protein WC026_17120, partial [Hyphomicrobium sp.]|uniref:hypothetical protein n=1 Tax=Hyphomicrobium sp. TaxID=82 RepID=UPI003561FA1A